MAVYEDVVPSVEVEPESRPARNFDRVRVADVPSGSEGEEYRALAAAHSAVGGGPGYLKWVGAICFDEDPVCPDDGILGVSAAGMASLAGADFGSEIDSLIVGQACEVIDAHEWAFFSADGSWISVSWDVNDFRVLGASNAFMDVYVEARPEAPDDALTWLHSEGYLFTDSVPVRRVERPRTPRILKPLLSRTEYEDRFEGSTTGEFLARLYGADVAGELWQLHLDMGEYADPLVGDAWKELARMKQERPELETRLREIWDGVSPPAA